MNKTLKYVFLALVVTALTLGGFAGGFVAGHLMPFGVPGLPSSVTSLEPNPPASPEQKAATPADYQTLFGPFWEAWNLVHKNYVDQPVDDTALMRGAITGMMQALGDQHSSYMDPEQFKEANSSLEGEYGGIGAYVDTTTQYLTITSTMPGYPAERAGLQPGDQVVKIDGEDMTGIDAELARRRVLGPANTTVHLTILREGEQDLLEFAVMREAIVLKSATGKMLDNGIAYVQITTFGAKTTPELLDTLTTLIAQNPKGIILDLRNNGGGYLQTAVEVTSQFVGDGVALYEVYGDKTRNTYNVQSGGLATDTKIPMVVLINEGSASASEIVAGALQDHGRAKLVGTVSYGKGSVQNWIPLTGDNGAVRITIAKWLTPNNHTIHKIGLTPDVFVGMTADDYKAKRDPQLDTAVEFLSHTIAGTPFTYQPPQPSPTLSAEQPSTSVTPAPIIPDPTATPNLVVCPLAISAHLTPGQSVTVTTRLNLRSSPSVKDNLLQVIPANTQVEVIGNPTCTSYSGFAYVWWQIKLPDGTIGWAAEGSIAGKFYFLEPVK